MFSLNLKMIQFTVIKEGFTQDRFEKSNQLSMEQIVTTC